MISILSIFLSIVLSTALEHKVTLVSFNLTSLQNSQQIITEEQAIALAEEFIVKNGYTKAPPAKKEELTPELLDKFASFETIMKLRHNSLEPKAYGLINKHPKGLGWTIIFLRTSKGDFDPKNGRGVSMTLEGKNLVMEPRDYLLSALDKQLKVENKENKENK